MGTRKRMLVGLFLVVLLAGGAGLGLGRTSVLAWYSVHRLTTAGDADREEWVGRVAALNGAAVPGLIECLRGNEGRQCGNAQAALARLAQQWGTSDPRLAALMGQLGEAFPRLSLAGQCSVLELGTANLTASVGQVGRLLALGVRSPDRDVRRRALALAAAWMARPDHAAGTSTCREVARLCLQDPDAGVRAAAVALAAGKEIGLGRQVAPLLDDPVAEVRRAAMLAIGGIDSTDPSAGPDAVATDDLLRSLHDTDADVRRLCEAALRSRGLVRAEDLALARLISHAQPGVRLQVLERLSDTAELEPGVWLRRLSQDPSPAVRAAAIRAAVERDDVDFADRLEKMAHQDPSDTVRQLAQHYLNCHKSNQKRLLER